ncbi:serine hydrolase domain-containing protein [Paenibacillus barengoltzii]|uniref:serine hydrolase domain-containing protein n=1 Tax=Paenibacillus barengoltzii TaxID=343517 RepID=UPI000A089B28|nr:serine hydrolase [Paenibacillus barengoltzii]SMF43925.1 CubicO group peptidase, beta-lactamase class C family [Paenibacillus barengoltzii]
MSVHTEKSLPRKSLKELGISARNVIHFLEYLKAHSIELHSFMLMRQGHVAAEGWWAPYGPDLPHMLFSLSKSFTSTAIGMAVYEGKLSLDDPVVSFFPEDVPEEVSPNLAAMQVKHLLMMGTGHAVDTMGALAGAKDGNWVKSFLALPVEHEPGTVFVYNTGATYMLSAILQKITGETLLEYLQPRLFEPLGIENPTWESCPRGINTGGFGLKVTTEDVAKFGQLYLQKGVWQGKRLVEESWIDAATSKQISNGNGGDSDWAQGYGYQFWRCRHGVYRGDGAFGQFCIVLPEQEAVLAMTSGTNDMQGILNGVWEHLLSAFSEGNGGSSEEDAAAEQELRHVLEGLVLEPPRLQADSEREAELGSGKECVLEPNDLDLQSTKIEIQGDTAVLTVKNPRGEHRIELGRHTWRLGRTALFGGEEQIAASFTWKSPETLLLTIQRIETPFRSSIDIEWLAEGVEIRHAINVSFGETASPPIRGHEQ